MSLSSKNGASNILILIHDHDKKVTTIGRSHSKRRRAEVDFKAFSERVYRSRNSTLATATTTATLERFAGDIRRLNSPGIRAQAKARSVLDDTAARHTCRAFDRHAGSHSLPTRVSWRRNSTAACSVYIARREYADNVSGNHDQPPRTSRRSMYARRARWRIVGHRGELLSVGREGALTGNRVDCFILDDL